MPTFDSYQWSWEPTDDRVRYRVALRGGGWKEFDTLPEARLFASEVFNETGVIAAIEEMKGENNDGKKAEQE